MAAGGRLILPFLPVSVGSASISPPYPISITLSQNRTCGFPAYGSCHSLLLKVYSLTSALSHFRAVITDSVVVKQPPVSIYHFPTPLLKTIPRSFLLLHNNSFPGSFQTSPCGKFRASTSCGFMVRFVHPTPPRFVNAEASMTGSLCSGKLCCLPFIATMNPVRLPLTFQPISLFGYMAYLVIPISRDGE